MAGNYMQVLMLYVRHEHATHNTTVENENKQDWIATIFVDADADGRRDGHSNRNVNSAKCLSSTTACTTDRHVIRGAILYM